MINKLLHLSTLFVSNIVLVSSIPEFSNGLSYHESYGIPEAARLKALAEEDDGILIRIVSGTNAKYGQFPYFAGLLIHLKGGRQSLCGASLISETRLLTAAHCWYDGNHQAYLIRVVLGSTSLFNGGTVINTSTVWTHEKFDPKTANNDIAMIVIRPVTYSNTIRNIALPMESLAKENFEGWNATIIGYGLHHDGAKVDGEHLQYAIVSVASNAMCKKVYTGYRDTNMCIHTMSGKSTCLGDSGGPLQIDDEDGEPVLIGISSFGAQSCEIGAPAGFTRITSYLKWIRIRINKSIKS